MSKSSIKWRDRSDGGIGFHLYEDPIECLVACDGDPEPSVYLRLDGVPVDLAAHPAGGVTVTVEIPREAARALGLLPPAASASTQAHCKGQDLLRRIADLDAERARLWAQHEAQADAPDADTARTGASS